MVDLNKLKPMDRRNFLKRGIQSGAVLVSLPLWKNMAWGDPAALLDGDAAAFLSKEDLRKLLEAALSKGGDFAEVYFEHTVQNNISLDEAKISTATRGLDMGAGFRVIKGEKTGYAFSDDLDPAKLKEAALTAALIADGRVSAAPQKFKPLAPPSFYLVETAPDGVAAKLKADLLLKANASGRGFDKRITQFRAGFSDMTKRIAIANSEGLYAEDTQTLTSLITTALALEGKQRSMGYESKAGAFGFEHFDVKLAEEFGRKAADMAVRNLPAEDAPAGEFPIVIARGYGGVFFHEAIGHSLEADGIRKKTAVFWDKLGKPIATPGVTLLDDGTYKGGWGTVNVDDEGQPGRKTVLIDKGKCAAFIQDKLSAGLMKMERTGNGRRQSFRFHPIPRMTNTYLLPGESDPGDIVKSIDKGLFIAKIGGGNVDTTTGRFVFSVTEGSMIEGGKVTKPLKGIMLMGSGQDVLKNISMVGNDLLIIGGGTCGKDGQGKPVGFGNPTLKVDKITVGGQRA
ncbi:MAG: TldD/PmbA family protein [Candidatus Aminicenantes bacterium]|nr:TldD/PmbA family protein [Candidatus Aminicenantes bacterium]